MEKLRPMLMGQQQQPPPPAPPADEPMALFSQLMQQQLSQVQQMQQQRAHEQQQAARIAMLEAQLRERQAERIEELEREIAEERSHRGQLEQHMARIAALLLQQVQGGAVPGLPEAPVAPGDLNPGDLNPGGGGEDVDSVHASPAREEQGAEGGMAP